MKKRSFRKKEKVGSVLLAQLAWIALLFVLGGCPWEDAATFAAFGAAVYLGFAPAGAIGYLLVSLVHFTPLFVYNRLLPALIYLVIAFAFGRMKRKPHFVFWALLAPVCLCVRFGFLGGNDEILPLIGLLLAVAALFCLVTVGVKGWVYRGLFCHLSTDEKCCLSVLYVLVLLGLYPLSFYGVRPSLVVGLFCSLVALFAFGSSAGLCTGLLTGIATSLAVGEAYPAAVFSLLILAATAFAKTSRILSVFAVLLFDILIAYATPFLPSYTYADLVTVAIGCVGALALPEKWIRALSEQMTGDKRQLLGLVKKRSGAFLRKRLFTLGGVFAEMSRVFGELGSEKIDPNTAVRSYTQDFIERVCEGCENKQACIDGRSHVYASVSELIASGLEKGRVSLLDLPDTLAKRCVKTKLALQVVGQYCVGYRQSATELANRQTARDLIAKELSGVAQIFKNLAYSDREESEVCGEKMQLLKDALLAERLDCREAVVQTVRGGYSACVTLPAEHAVSDVISKTASRLLGQTMMVSERSDTGEKGITAVYMVTAPKYDVVFGACGLPKSGSRTSGDTHSLIQLAEDRFMIALCDGMGSGEQAERTSRNAISLIEAFYRAGFDSDLILESVNGLLSCCCEEAFCALDVVVADLTSGRCDCIKLGAPPSFVKSESVRVIAGNALPLGILEESRPSTEYVALKPNDMLVVMTDGISDAFTDHSVIKKAVEQLQTANPQELCENLMARALSAYGGKPKDDMTVMALRLFEKT